MNLPDLTGLRVATARVSYAGPGRLDITRKGEDPIGSAWAPPWTLVMPIIDMRHAGAPECELAPRITGLRPSTSLHRTCAPAATRWAADALRAARSSGTSTKRSSRAIITGPTRTRIGTTGAETTRHEQHLLLRLLGWNRAFPPRLVHVQGWTALAFWDRSSDRRGGSNSAILAAGTLDFEAMVAIAADNFPSVWARITTAFEVRLGP